MCRSMSTAGAAARVAAIWLVALTLCMAPQAAFAAKAAGTSAAPASEEATSSKVHELLTLLADPKVQEWLEKQDEAKAAAGAASGTADNSISHELNSDLSAIREHIVGLAAALPDLPDQFQRGSTRVTAELGHGGRTRALLLLAVFVGLGFGLEWLFRQATQGVRVRLDALSLDTVGNRLRVVAVRFAFAFGLVAVFAIGSVGAFLAFDWPPLLRELLFGYLIAFLALRVANIVGHFLLAPHHEHFRIIPMDTAAARFWCRRLSAFVGVFAFGWVLFGLGATLGWSLEARQIVAYTLGLVLLAIALEAVWRRPVTPEDAIEVSSPAKHHRLGQGGRNTLLSIGIVLLWVLWVLHAMASFWLMLVAITLPLAIGVTRGAVEHLLRPCSAEAAEGGPTVLTICLERGIRALLIIGAVAVLAWGGASISPTFTAKIRGWGG